MGRLRPLLPLGGIAALLVACLFVEPGSLHAEDGGVSKPPLVLVIAVDQLRRDRLSADLPGGLGRVVRSGRVYEQATLSFAHSETCPGHAVMLTGRHPGPAGIPSNNFVERAALKVRYCVDDPDPKAASFGGSGVGRSPRNLRASTLGDWIKAQHPGARVFSVSGKDRSAIMLGGQQPDGVYWFDWAGSRPFTTSGYYVDALPGWLATWTREKVLQGIPTRWEYAPAEGARRDDFAGEATRFSAVSPHPLPMSERDAQALAKSMEAMSPEQRTLAARRLSLAPLYFSPFLDQVTLRFARELVVREELGSRDVPELLALSLSGTDLVGHLYGPRSQEAADALARLDRELGAFLDFIEARVGKDRLLIALTADHGVLPLPEWLLADGRETCPVSGGRVNAQVLHGALNAELAATFGAPSPNRTRDAGATALAPRWLIAEGFRLTLNEPLCSEQGVAPQAVIATAKNFLRAQPGVARVWTPADFADAVSGTKAELYRNSYDRQRGGDLIIEPAPGCLFSPNATGTTHGSPHAYDRDVPIVLSGPGVRVGRDARPAATVDIGPTLAALLGVETPPGLDGQVLPLAP